MMGARSKIRENKGGAEQNEEVWVAGMMWYGEIYNLDIREK